MNFDRENENSIDVLVESNNYKLIKRHFKVNYSMHENSNPALTDLQSSHSCYIITYIQYNL